MDDDDEMEEIRSRATPSPSLSPSPSSPPDGRITVAAAPASQSNNSLASPTMPVHVAIQMQQQQPPPKINGGREDCWSEEATAVLIDAWGERYLELSRGNLKQKHWKEVADIVNGREDYTKSAKTDIQCKNRIDTVKKKYKMEKAKIAAGVGSSKWPLFDRLDRLIGPVAKNANVMNQTKPSVASSGFDVSASKVPVGIPVGTGRISAPRSNIYQKVRLENDPRFVKKEQIRTHVETESDSDDCWLPPAKKSRASGDVVMQGGLNLKPKEKKQGWGNCIRMLTQAMIKFGQVYEQAENAKLQQVVEMEKARMKFAKELELQRMQFLMKTQMEISQLKPFTKRRNGNGNKHLINSSSNNVIIMDSNNNSSSDS